MLILFNSFISIVLYVDANIDVNLWCIVEILAVRAVFIGIQLMVGVSRI